jgi:hypothetical protein
VSDAKAEAEQLLNAVVPFAEHMLTKDGEFFPYAMALKPAGEITPVAGFDGREQPPSQAIIDLLLAGLQADARAGRVKATALVYEVRITDPPHGEEVGRHSRGSGPSR